MRGTQLRLWLALSSLVAAISAPISAFADETALSSPLAYNYGEQETARSAAMGGALRAFGNSTAAVYLNPAGMVSTRVYHLEGVAQLTPEAARQVYGGAIVDSVTGRLAGGLAISGGAIDPNGLDRSLLDARMALAYPLGNSLALGAGARYLKVTQDGLGPLGESKVSGGLQDPEGGRFPFVDTFSFDAGLLVRLGDALRLGASGQNLSYPGHALLPTTLGGGLGYGGSDLSVEVDALADFNSYDETTARFMIGGEYLLGDHIPLRAGYRYDAGGSLHALSAGLGYIGTEFGIEGGVRRTFGEDATTTIVLQLGYFLESSGLTRTPEGFD
jgi:hypothetical protein